MKQALVLFIMFSFFSKVQSKNTIIIDNTALQKLEKFKKETKFEIDTNIANYYNGLSNPNLKTKFSELLNLVADDFILTVKNNPSDKKFQENIKMGLSKFNPYYMDLDTEDREKVCSYFIELMDCVGLQSSNGEINKWLYGFDPARKQ